MRNRLISSVIYFVVFLFLCQPLWAEVQFSKERVKVLYRQALSFYQRGQFDEATEAFGQILELDPKHKGANAYLEVKIPDRIAKLETDGHHLKLLKEKRVQRQHQKQACVVDKLLNQVETRQQKQHSALEKTLERKLQEKIRPKVKQLYKKGVRAYRMQEYNLATNLFNQVLLLDPRNKHAQVYLQKIPQQKSGSVSVGQ